MAKIVRIRLYRVQDYDLYAIYYDKKNFRLSKMFTAAISAFANGRPLPVFSLKNISSLPKPVKADNGEVIRGSGLKFTLIMSFSIPDYDTKAIALIDYLTKEQTANSFLKTLVRRCFTDMEYMYLDESIRAQFPDPGSMVMTRESQPGASSKTKKPRRENKRPAKPAVSSSPSRNDPGANAAAAVRVRQKTGIEEQTASSNNTSTTNIFSHAEPVYIVKEQPVSDAPMSPSPDPVKEELRSETASAGDDLFSLVQGFEF